jgi:hypothetical protein
MTRGVARAWRLDACATTPVARRTRPHAGLFRYRVRRPAAAGERDARVRLRARAARLRRPRRLRRPAPAICGAALAAVPAVAVEGTRWVLCFTKGGAVLQRSAGRGARVSELRAACVAQLA